MLSVNLPHRLIQGGVVLDITYRNNRLRRICTDAKFSDKIYGTEMSEKHINRLINGDVQLTPDVALRLEYELAI